MELNDYQKQAQLTDRTGSSERAQTISHFGLIGEIGSLLTVFKKRLRDQGSYSSFDRDLKEELGDVLWYLSNICTRYNLSLDDVATSNLEKVGALWGINSASSENSYRFDEEFSESEKLPRQLDLTFLEESVSEDSSVVRVYVDGALVGDPLTDNSYKDDGYRFHDIFHLSYAVFLGWSPLLRKVLNRKRKSDPWTDEVEDGARARIAEEAVSLYIYGYAFNHSFFEAIDTVDTQVLRGISALVDGLEVSQVPYFQWKRAILEGYRVFRLLRHQGGGTVRGDMDQQTLELIQ